jgi:hypothetical protein
MAHVYLSVICKTPECGHVLAIKDLGEYQGVPMEAGDAFPLGCIWECVHCGQTHRYAQAECHMELLENV